MSDFSRRELVKAAGLAAGAVACAAIADDTSPVKREALVLKFGGYDFPRLAGLTDGRVPIKGCELEFVPGKIGDKALQTSCVALQAGQPAGYAPVLEQRHGADHPVRQTPGHELGGFRCEREGHL